MIGLYLHELEVGRKIALGSYAFNENNINAFKQKYAPVPFHHSNQNAKSLFAGPVAVGFHICSAWMICFVRTNTSAREGLAKVGKSLPEIGPSPGLQNIRWPHPVSPGDTVSFTALITAKRELQTRPQWGIISSLNEGFNQHGTLVMSFESKGLVARLTT